MKKIAIYPLIALITLLSNGVEINAQKRLDRSDFSIVCDMVHEYIKPLASIGGKTAIESVVEKPNRHLEITFTINMSDYPLRSENISTIYSIVKHHLPERYKGYTITLKSNKSTLEELASKYYTQKNLKKIEDRIDHIRPNIHSGFPENKLVFNSSHPGNISNGLQNNHIAVWQSHGYYYNQNDMRWQWQRATLFQTVEDLYTQSYVLPFLVPMLENAGATVLLPRERDHQIHEVVVDGDDIDSGYFEISKEHEWKKSTVPGFANPKKEYETGENPFKMGSARYINSTTGSSPSQAIWRPDIPEKGEYAVYVSYQSLPNSSEDAQYIVHHKGGQTEFRVNQKMSGSTWVYLGTFSFDEGCNNDQYVTLLNSSSKRNNSVVVADAVKFGGGMGNIARKPSPEIIQNRKSSSNEQLATIKQRFEPEPETSGYPRFTEGSRYWLQWAGFADSIYTANENKNDYNDDYMSRGRWVNTMVKDYNVPIDLSLAFHTDAGTTLNDSIIGTLAIYTRFSEGKDKFPDGRARITSRELADIVQTQIVDDVRQLYESEWSRRGLWDRSYAESRSPDVPSMLLELLSHQNMADMRYGLNPEFRFHVSRAIYKGILKYLSFTNNFDYVVQPLPVKSFYSELENSLKQGIKPRVKLSWEATLDPLEPTATPQKYILYTRIYDPLKGDEHAAFDNGVVVEKNEISLNVEYGKIYSYKVTAINSGGESFPSEILSVGFTSPEAKTLLIVNGFDRVSAPFNYATPDSTRAGFESYIDGGVPYIRDFSFIGNQYEFRRHIPWMHDNRPGFGASHRDYETKVVAGNTFDYPFSHGISIMKKGYNFVSSGREALISGKVDPKKYPVMDMIMGKQVKILDGRGHGDPKFETFSLPLQNIIRDFCNSGGNIMVSGAYIATDLWDTFYDKEGEPSPSDRMNDMDRELNSMGRKINEVLISLKERERELFSKYGKEWFTTKDSLFVIEIERHISQYNQMIDSLKKISQKTGELISDFENNTAPEEKGRTFAKEVLKYGWGTYMASATGELKAIQNPFGFRGEYSFDNKPNEKIYCVESSDGLIPQGDDAWTIYRYKDSNISAGVAYDGDNYKSVSLGFPIETLKNREQIDRIVSDILDFFENGAK